MGEDCLVDVSILLCSGSIAMIFNLKGNCNFNMSNVVDKNQFR